MSDFEYLALCLITAWLVLCSATLVACLVCGMSLRFLAFSRGYLVVIRGEHDVRIYDEEGSLVVRSDSSYARQWLRLR